MANEAMKIVDPLGKAVYLLPAICGEKNEHHEVYDDAATVIHKPAILVETRENGELQFHYFRSVGWNSTLLIAARFQNHRWEAYSCVKNPTTRELSAILKRGKQII
jgi:hypothetical protein